MCDFANKREKKAVFFRKNSKNGAKWEGVGKNGARAES